MELDLSSDQELLRETAARFIEAQRARCPWCARLIGSETGLPAGYLRGAGELGWFAMLVPEELGGGSVSGAGLRDLADHRRGAGPRAPTRPVRLHERRGRRVGRCRVAGATGAILPRSAAGEPSPPGCSATASRVRPGRSVIATPRGGGFAFSGTGSPSRRRPGATGSSSRLRDDTGASQFLVEATSPGITMTPLEALDITQRYAVRVLRRRGRAGARRPSDTPGGPSTTSNVNSSWPACCPPRRRSAPWMRSSSSRAVRHRPHGLRPAHRLLPGGEAPAGRHEPVSRGEQSRYGGRGPGGAGRPGGCG